MSIFQHVAAIIVLAAAMLAFWALVRPARPRPARGRFCGDLSSQLGVGGVSRPAGVVCSCRPGHRGSHRGHGPDGRMHQWWT